MLHFLGQTEFVYVEGEIKYFDVWDMNELCFSLQRVCPFPVVSH